MEWKVGEIKQVNGEWYQCVEGTGCYQCAFNQDADTCLADDPHCTSRSDRKDVIFKKLKKAGEPFIVKGKKYQAYITHVHPYILNEPNSMPVDDSIVVVEIKQTKEDMEEKNNGNTPLNVLTDKYVNGDICYDDFEKEVKALYSCKEEIKPNLKEFDLEAAKLGKPVCTRDGRKARIICFDANNPRPIIALVNITGEDSRKFELFGNYYNSGRHYDGVDNPTDLMMLTEKRLAWVNVYRGEDGHLKVYNIYDTREDAEMQKSKRFKDGYIATAEVSWEEYP